MKFLVILLAALTLASCTRIGTGEIGLIRGFDKQIRKEPVLPGEFEVCFLDTCDVIDGTQVRVPVEGSAKDIDGILFEKIEAQITYNTIPAGAPSFYEFTKEIETNPHSHEEVIGFRVIEKEAKNALVRTFTEFKAIQVNTDKPAMAERLRILLSEELDKRFPNTFLIVDVNIDTAKLDSKVEAVLQNQALIDSEKRTVASQIELQKLKSNMLDQELMEIKATSNKVGISVSELLKYKNDKERNKVLSEMARNNTNTQIQVKD